MKKSFMLLFWSLTIVFLLPVGVSAIGDVGLVSIDGPSGRCGAAAGVPTTYTGSHDFPASGCTIYEWTIEGGTISTTNVLPGEVPISITNGTLCIVEFTECLADVGPDCDVADGDSDVGTGNGADVTVVWFPGVKGKLKLKVTEKGKGLKASSQTEIENDLTFPDITSISVSSNPGGTSSVLTANLDDSLCPGMAVSWTLNGSSAGLGNSITLPVGSCASGNVCATVIQIGTGLSSNTVCRTFDGGTLIDAIAGPTQVAPNSLVDYFYNSNQPVSSINWTVSPATGVSFISPTNTQGVLLTFMQKGIYTLCAQGTNGCGNMFSECIEVDVDNGFAPITAPGTTTPNAERLDAEVKVNPTLVNAGKEINIQLPYFEEAVVGITIMDIQGRPVQQLQTQDTQLAIPTRDLPAGIYILTAQAGAWVSSNKFVVK